MPSRYPDLAEVHTASDAISSSSICRADLLPTRAFAFYSIGKSQHSELAPDFTLYPVWMFAIDFIILTLRFKSTHILVNVLVLSTRHSKSSGKRELQLREQIAIRLPVGVFS